MKSQQVMLCNYCNGQGWINAHEQCPVCQGAGYVPLMTMPAVRQQKPKKPKPAPPPQTAPQPIYQQQPVYQQQPQPGNQLHIYVHSDQGQPEYQRSAVPVTPTPGPAKGISIFQICCIAAVILAILSWGGAL